MTGYFAGIVCLLLAWMITIIVGPAIDPIQDASPEEAALIQNYLQDYGYGTAETNEQLRDALIKLQMFMGLAKTGYINPATLDRTSWIRCQVIDPADRIEISKQASDYKYLLNSDEQHWDNLSLSYSLHAQNRPEDSTDVIEAVKDALLGWIRTSPVKFYYKGTGAQIVIEIVSNVRVEFDENEFGNASSPTDGQIYINGGLEISVTPEPSGLSLESMIMHEIGHALGLEHVPDKYSIMNPYYKIFYKNPQPGEGDIDGIRYLYIICSEEETVDGDLTLTWPDTMKDTIAPSIEVCPSYSINAGKPLAYRYCRKVVTDADRMAQWDSPMNFTVCLEGDPNDHAANLSKVAVNETNIVEIAEALVEITNHTADVTAEGIDAIADTLSNIANVRYPSPEVTSSVLAVVNNVLNVNPNHLQNTPNADSPSTIIRSLERQVGTLQLKNNGNWSDTRENIAVKAYNYPIETLRSPIVFAKLRPPANASYDGGITEKNTEIYYDPEDIPENQTETSIKLPPEIVKQFLRNRRRDSAYNITTVPVTFTIFASNRIFVPYQPKGRRAFGPAYGPKSKGRENPGPSDDEPEYSESTPPYGPDTSDGTSPTDEPGSYTPSPGVMGNNGSLPDGRRNKDSSGGRKKSEHKCNTRPPIASGEVQGHVISASVEGVSVLSLQEPVTITFTSNNPQELSENADQLHCVYWNFRGVNWYTSQCSLREVTSNGQIVCECRHLTNFAVLLSPYDDALSHFVYDIFNTIFVCLSIIGLVITLLMYMLIPKLNQQPSIRVHMNFMVSLLCLYIVFIFGIDMIHLPDGCIVIAILIHYFTLSTVFLMGAEAITMYFLFVSVIGQQGGIKQIPFYVLRVAIVAWGVPLLMVIITVSTSYCQYYNEDFCFLPSGYVLYFGVILPIGLILLANLVVFSMVTYRITRKRKFTQKNARNADQKRQREMVRQFYRVLSLFTVLGLAWIFGLLASIYHVRFFFQVLFTLTTSLQGVFIFLLFCVRHHDVLETWKRWSRRVRGKPTGGRDIERNGTRGGRGEIATAPRSPSTPLSTTASPTALIPPRSFSSSSHNSSQNSGV